MAFLFKSKKNQQGTGLPPATRNVHTSEGAPASAGQAPVNGVKERDGGSSQTPTPSSSYNNSLNSVNSTTSPENQRVRQRAESESQVGLLPQSIMFTHLVTRGSGDVGSLRQLIRNRFNDLRQRQTAPLPPEPARAPPSTHGHNVDSTFLISRQILSHGMVLRSTRLPPRRAIFI